MKVRSLILMMVMLGAATDAVCAVPVIPIPAPAVQTQPQEPAAAEEPKKPPQNEAPKVETPKEQPPKPKSDSKPETKPATEPANAAAAQTTATTVEEIERPHVEQSTTTTASPTGSDIATTTQSTTPLPAPTPRWPLYASLAVIGLLLAAITWVAARLFKRMSAPAPKLDETELGRRLNKLATNLEAHIDYVTDKLQKQADELSASLIALPTSDQLDARIAVIRHDLAKLTEIVETIVTTPDEPQRLQLPAADPVALEHQVLGETWKQFRANKELSAVFENAMQESTWEPLINDLAKVVPDDLKPTFDAVVTPWREHRTLVQKISLVPRIVNGELKRLESDAEELRRTREYASILTIAQSSGDGAARLNFRFKSWITDTFLPFADLYLQRYQQAQLERRGGELHAGAGIVRQVLRIAAVEPIDVTPGETAFDSTRHIGRSTSNDPRFSDGVITGVVRNGFIERGQQVIRQPEVIVNRMR